MNAPRQCYIEINLAPSEEYKGVSIVPNVLHLTWKTGRRGDQNAAGEEPVEAHEWRLVLFRDGNKMYRLANDWVVHARCFIRATL